MAVPYYPLITETPSLGLSLIGMDEVIALDMVAIDAAFGSLNVRNGADPALVSTLASGHNTIAIGIAGTKKSIQSFVHNPTVSSINVFSEISIDGGVTWFQTTATQAVAANATVTVTQSINPYQVGMMYGINASASGLVVNSNVQLFPDSVTLSTSVLTQWVVGNNLLFTVPSGFRYFSNNNPVVFFNATGGNVSVAYHIVPPGGSPSLSNRVFFNAALANNAQASVAFFSTILEGYSLVIVSSSAGKQFAGASYSVIAT